MVDHKKPVRLQDLSAAVGQPPQTVLRFLNTLRDRRYVNQDEATLHYYLTMKFFSLGNGVNAQQSIRDVAHPYLVKIAQYYGESACLAIEERSRVIYIDVEYDSDAFLNVTQRIGKEAPLYCTGVGKLFLLNRTKEEVIHYMENTEIKAFTKNTITTASGILSELERIQERGYAVDDEECEIGACCLAAPIRDSTGEVIACISVAGPLTRLNKEKMDFIVPTILEITQKISKEFGYSSVN